MKYIFQFINLKENILTNFLNAENSGVMFTLENEYVANYL